MIIREKPKGIELFFVLRGSLVQRILPKIAIAAGISLSVVVLDRLSVVHFSPITPLGLSVIGAALAIFAAFRNAAAYDRWWEARKLLGQVVIEARNLARQAGAYIAVVPGDDAPRRIALACIAFMHSLRDFLRSAPVSEDTTRYLTADQQAALMMSMNAPNRLLDFVSAEIAAALAADRLEPQMAQTLEERVAGLTAGLASTERTKNTPMPFVYTLLVHRTAYMFCFLMPFGLADAAGFWTPLIAAVVAYTFFGVDAIGEELEAPFSDSVNALPLDALARVVEINILESLGETQLPAAPRPTNFVLT